MAKFGEISNRDGLEKPYAEMADDRLSAEKELLPYRDLLIEYCGERGRSGLWEWVATAPVEEVVAWAVDIQANKE